MAATVVPSPAGAEPVPAISLSLSAANVGQPVTVIGTGFPATTSVSLQVCGNAAGHGSSDCDTLAGQTVVTDEIGSFRSSVVVRYAPVPCPCVVWAVSNGIKPASAIAPIGVVTGVYATSKGSDPAPEPVATTRLEVLDVSTRQPDAWKSWLGIASPHELVVTLRNAGTSTIAHPVLSLTLGRGIDPTELLPSPTLEALQPGEVRTVVVPFDLGALAVGGYNVQGTVGTTVGEGSELRAHVSSFPWLLVIGAIALIVAMVRRRRRARRHDALLDQEIETLIEMEAETETETGASDEDAPARVAVTFTFPDWVIADTVALCGEFNDWSEEQHPLTHVDGGCWETVVELDANRSYRYRFIIDGDRWRNDWAPDAFVTNVYGSQDSVIEVGSEDRFANRHERRAGQPLPAASWDGPADDGGDGDDAGDDPWDAFWAEAHEPLMVRLRNRRA
jgi:hypothetical protein